MDDEPGVANRDCQLCISTCHELANRGARSHGVHCANVALDPDPQFRRLFAAIEASFGPADGEGGYGDDNHSIDTLQAVIIAGDGG